ncbi:hypothetical protein QJS10_CPB13g01077 [Acorus calamus]|uniref:Uncharacterized protein n=1 Tax=Acorus calamus TaxID=4465 RepID=A0AAV9DHH9_ACOCL|nr:hypothetical protein QJS10_CPB13g01077 [Acorus calamus]
MTGFREGSSSLEELWWAGKCLRPRGDKGAKSKDPSTNKRYFTTLSKDDKVNEINIEYLVDLTPRTSE